MLAALIDYIVLISSPKYSTSQTGLTLRIMSRNFLWFLVFYQFFLPLGMNMDIDFLFPHVIFTEESLGPTLFSLF